MHETPKWFIFVIWNLMSHKHASLGLNDENFDNNFYLVKSNSGYTNEMLCASQERQSLCHQMCTNGKPLCIETQCYCILETVYDTSMEENPLIRLLGLSLPVDDKSIENKFMNIQRPKSESEIIPELFYETSSEEINKENPTYNLAFSVRPALRHHIAHFCPDLNIARQCIKKCMKLGKPAFCGKDHVCYCGHTLSNHDKNPQIDVNAMYNQYKDLYDKYFGGKEESEEAHEDQVNSDGFSNSNNIHIVEINSSEMSNKLARFKNNKERGVINTENDNIGENHNDYDNVEENKEDKERNQNTADGNRHIKEGNHKTKTEDNNGDTKNVHSKRKRRTKRIR